MQTPGPIRQYLGIGIGDRVAHGHFPNIPRWMNLCQTACWVDHVGAKPPCLWIKNLQLWDVIYEIIQYEYHGQNVLLIHNGKCLRQVERDRVPQNLISWRPWMSYHISIISIALTSRRARIRNCSAGSEKKISRSWEKHLKREKFEFEQVERLAEWILFTIIWSLILITWNRTRVTWSSSAPLY